MSKHTPGPWRYLGRVKTGDDDTLEWPTVECAPQRYIKPEGRTSDECEANARLIAVAPDLLEAAIVQKECGPPSKVTLYDEDGCEGWRWQHPDGREWAEIGDWDEPPTLHPLMRIAIAKAKGDGE